LKPKGSKADQEKPSGKIGKKYSVYGSHGKPGGIDPKKIQQTP